MSAKPLKRLLFFTASLVVGLAGARESQADIIPVNTFAPCLTTADNSEECCEKHCDTDSAGDTGNTCTDDNDCDGGSGTCVEGDGDNSSCTLGEAICAANTNAFYGGCDSGDPGLDVIELQTAGIYILTEEDNTTCDDGPNGTPVITEDLIINGNESAIVRDSSNGVCDTATTHLCTAGDIDDTCTSNSDCDESFRAFEIDENANVIMNDLLIGGFNPDCEDSCGGNETICYSGGAILVEGEGVLEAFEEAEERIPDLKLHRAVVLGNTTNVEIVPDNEDHLQSGGAVFLKLGAIGEITNSIFLFNFSLQGGAIGSEFLSTLLIGDSSFTLNLGLLDGNGLIRGVCDIGDTGLCLSGAVGDGCTFDSDCDVQGSANVEEIATGGAISARGSDVTIEQSTFFHNLAQNYGGALFLTCADTDITNTSIFQNRARIGSGIAALPNCHQEEDVEDLPAGLLTIFDVLGIPDINILSSTITENGPCPPGFIGELLCEEEGGPLEEVTPEEGGGFANTSLLNGMMMVNLKNTIVSNNFARTGPDCAGSFVSQGHNLLGQVNDINNDCVATLVPSDIVGPPGLGECLAIIDPLVTDLASDALGGSLSLLQALEALFDFFIPLAGQQYCEPLCDGDTGCSDTCQERESLCGNKILDPGEDCDDGNSSNSDFCRIDCTFVPSNCGDGFVQNGEDCDDRNLIDDDTCNACISVPPTTDAPGDCGNGSVDPGEQCDDSNQDIGDGCSNNCRFENVCGNGYVDDGEECDDGNLNNQDACLFPNCTIAETFCGDGIVQFGEECDDGNPVDDDICSNHCTLAPCGDGIVQGEGSGIEECDDGKRCSASPSPPDFLCVDESQCSLGQCVNDECLRRPLFACTADGDCNFGTCTDGGGTLCTGNNDFACHGNDFECTGTCSNGICSNTPAIACTGATNCDFGDCENTSSDCSDNCLVAPNDCGGTFGLQGAEECDDQNQDNTDHCLNNCTIAACGDGIVQIFFGECIASTCIDNSPCTVDSDCTLSEQCDDGNTEDGDGCDSLCFVEVCGDGIAQPTNFEACDVSQAIDNGGAEGSGFECPKFDQIHTERYADDACDIGAIEGFCEDPVFCGNGIVEPNGADGLPDTGDEEACDDGNNSNNDACPDGPGGTCQPAICGDGFFWVGSHEECDDGKQCDNDRTVSCTSDQDCAGVGGACNQHNDDDCVIINGSCREARCGDGQLNTTGSITETCDDGNTNAGDGCNGLCESEDGLCGNGTVDPIEMCDINDPTPLPPGILCVNCFLVPGGGGTPNPCGNGVLDSDGPNDIEGDEDDEECDDGNNNAGDGCNGLCKIESGPEGGFCGNGQPDPNEECDLGENLNADAPNIPCREDCTLPICGDGIVDNVLLGEECDSTLCSCTEDCKIAECPPECSISRDVLLDPNRRYVDILNEFGFEEVKKCLQVTGGAKGDKFKSADGGGCSLTLP